MRMTKFVVGGSSFAMFKMGYPLPDRLMKPLYRTARMKPINDADAVGIVEAIQ